MTNDFTVSLRKVLFDCSMQMNRITGCDFADVIDAVDETVSSCENSGERYECYRQLRYLFADGIQDINFLPLAGYVLNRFYNAFARRPEVVLWNGRKIEKHLVPNGSGSKEITLLRVEAVYPSNGFLFLKSAAVLHTIDLPPENDPLGNYNCFSLVFHTSGDFLSAGGCVDHSKVGYCRLDPQMWPSFEKKVHYPREIIRNCQSPAAHIKKEGWRFVNVLEEKVRPGDIVLYLMDMNDDVFMKVHTDPKLKEYYMKRHLPELPFMTIEHAAIVVKVMDNEILVAEKLDNGPAVISSAFDNLSSYGFLFVIMRRDDSDAIVLPELGNSLCLSQNETEKAAETNPNAKEFMEHIRAEERWNKMRVKNCSKNPKCPGY